MRPSIYLGGKESIKFGLDEAHSHKSNKNFNRQIPQGPGSLEFTLSLGTNGPDIKESNFVFYKKWRMGVGTSVEQNNVTQLSSVSEHTSAGGRL